MKKKRKAKAAQVPPATELVLEPVLEAEMPEIPLIPAVETEPETRAHYLQVLGLMVACLVLSSALMVWMRPEPKVPAAGGDESIAANAEQAGRGMVEAKPQRLRIPTVAIDTTFEGGLGLNDDQSVQVPDSYTKVGWYKYGPTPGELGPAVILGHVDSYQGPAVFWSLGQLKAGDEILVDREDGTTAVFEVTELKRVSQSDFPTREVYGDLDYAGLRLITCTGTYNHGVQRYSHNLIVFARLKSANVGGEVVE